MSYPPFFLDYYGCLGFEKENCQNLILFRGTTIHSLFMLLQWCPYKSDIKWRLKSPQHRYSSLNFNKKIIDEMLVKNLIVLGLVHKPFCGIGMTASLSRSYNASYPIENVLTNFCEFDWSPDYPNPNER